ncbi:hypothetical protein J8J27_25445, partial [Mycobacterium tuberculosis]|nr:hypothetical protein [Mycobacterium tuberculosis]
AETSYRAHLLDLGSEPARATPLIDALALLPGRCTVLICHVEPSELDELRDRFPAAVVLAPAEFTVDILCHHNPQAGLARRGRAAPANLESLVEAATALRA